MEQKALHLSSVASSGKRVDAFDIMKGIAILLMIVGHTTGKIPLLRDFIFSFHMPLFFLLSGYFFRPAPVGLALKKNFKRLYVPYLFTALLLALHMMTVAYCNGQDVWGVGLVRLRATLLGSGAPLVLGMRPAIGAIWFLAALFWALLWLNLALRTRFPLLVCLLLAALSFALQGEIFLPQSIQPACSATLFLYIGYSARRYQWLERAGRLTSAGLKRLFSPPFCNPLADAAAGCSQESGATRPWLWAFVCAALWYTAWMRGKLEMSCDYYRFWYFDMLAAVAAVWLVYQWAVWLDASRFVRLKRFFCFFGRYSLVVLCFHLYELNCISWKNVVPLDWGDGVLPIFWVLKFIWAYLCIQLTLHVPFLRKIFQIKG
ncbi:MAG: acyltransferase family protein [Bacteroidaceae bacterium]|jgi:fucose 4-O-acetylase-like acetyltransferase